MELLPIVETYCLAVPDTPRDEVVRIVAAAAERARAKHADFDRFLPAIEFLAKAFFTDHKAMPLDDYIETLYCAVKHADFTRSWRGLLKRPAAAVATIQ